MSYPRLNLTGADLALKFLPCRAGLADQFGGFNTAALVDYISQCRQDFPIKAAMMFLCAFLQFAVQVLRNIL